MYRALFLVVVLLQLLMAALVPAFGRTTPNHVDSSTAPQLSISENHQRSPTLLAQSNRTRSTSKPLEITSIRESTRFDVNDISFLWPVPSTAQEVDTLLTADVKTANGTSQIWPQSAFDAVIEKAQTVKVSESTGTERQINFDDGPLATTFNQFNTWKVVAMRIDPSAPGSSSKMINTFGSVPQIRLTMQPVTVDNNGQIRVHDYTTHLVYNFTKGTQRPAIPDQEKFKEIVRDLKRIKANLAASGISTDGKPLGTHPGFRLNSSSFRNQLKTFITKHLTEDNLAAVSFMGLEPPEPWIFFAMQKQQNGSFTQIEAPTLGGNKAQMLSFRGDKAVMPEPNTTNLGNGKGVSTSLLFDVNARSKLSSKVLADQTRPRFREIPDMIANPERSHFFNTDCVSCHSASARRQNLAISTGDALFKYKRPEGISGVDPALLPVNSWNVRSFGWFPDFRRARPTVTLRTANETAEAAEFINHHYLINTPVNNLVAKNNGGAHLRRKPAQLSALNKQDICTLKPNQSVGIDKIESAANGFSKVHVVLPHSSCPSFQGDKKDIFIFPKHFDTAPITKVVSKRIGSGGAILRRRPLQLSALGKEDICKLKPNQSVGINAIQAARDGFSKVNIIVPSPSCASFKGEVFVFNKHFSFD